MGRRVFTREFKLEAVKLVKERGVSVSQVAKDLDIGPSVVGRWVREGSKDKGHAFPGRGQMKPDDAEIARLKRELARTKAERKKPSDSSRRIRREVRGDCRVSTPLAAILDVRDLWCHACGILCLVEAPTERPEAARYRADRIDPRKLRRQRSDLRSASGEARSS